MRDRLLIKLASWAVDSTWWMVAIAVTLTVLFGGLAGRMELSAKWSDMLPKGDKRTVEFDRILEEFISASSIVIVVQGEEDQIKAFADSLAPRLLEPLPVPGRGSERKVFVRRVDYKKEVDFIKNHGFMLMKATDLENLKEVFTDPNLIPLLTNINNSFEKEYFSTKEVLSTREEEDGAIMFLDGIQSWLTLMKRYLSGNVVPQQETDTAVNKLLLGDPYFVSYDRKALLMNVIPNFSMMDTDPMVKGTDAVQALVDKTVASFPGVRAGLTGAIPLGRDEMVYSMEGLEYTSLLALVAIGILLIVSFRMWVAPVLALVNLLVGLIWAMGVVALFVPVLNIMTAMFVVVLLGLGIDFSIHIIASFTEMRALGHPIDTAMQQGLLRSGKGVMTGAATTACAFFALMIGRSRALSEMGLVTGIGLLVVCVVSFTTLPSLLVIRERIHEKQAARKFQPSFIEPRDISFVFLGRMSSFLKKQYGFALLGAIILTGLFIWSAERITFDHNYMNIEVEGIPSVTLQDTVLDKFDLSMDFAYLTAGSVEESRMLAKKAKEYSSVAMVEDISSYLPSPEEQEKRRPHVEEIEQLISSGKSNQRGTLMDLNKLMREIERLEINVMELQVLSFLGGQDKVDEKCRALAGDPDQEQKETIFGRLNTILESRDETVLAGANAFQNDYADHFRNSVLQMANMDPILLKILPESILDRYSNRDRSLFLVTVLPGNNIWQDARFLKRFTDDLEEISDRATGFPPVFRALIEIIGRDGRNAAMLTVMVVFILLTIDFRHPGHAVMAMIPLAAGMSWMVGIMQLLGDQLDVMNVMAIPLIIGIGIDDGVHIVHRWKREGFGSEKTVFASTGKAILLTSLTTMLAFGSLVFSIWRGYGSLGSALFIGVGTCFLTTVLILPGIIGWIERKKG